MCSLVAVARVPAALQVDPTVATDRSAGAIDLTALIPVPLIIGAVTNLVTNAWKHGSGPIALDARATRGKRVRISVSDSGVGVADRTGKS